jgi:hypothetical protein
MDCGQRVEYGAKCCAGGLNTSWQARVNPDNVRWAPGYRFKTIKDSGYRHYNCFYGIDRNGNIEFQGGVRAPKEQIAGIEERYARERLGVNGFPGCEE